LSTFYFRNFKIIQSNTPAKVGTDALLLATWTDIDDVGSILDIGTGTGVIALLLAQRSPESNIVALEPDLVSFQEACDNFTMSPFKRRIQCCNLSLQEYAHAENAMGFDLIISNPPFFDGGVLSDNDKRNYWRHTLGLTHHELLNGIDRLLAPGGKFFLILPMVEGKKFITLAYKSKFYLCRYAFVAPMRDQQPNRMLVCFSRSLQHLSQEHIILYEDRGQTRTKQYIDMLFPYIPIQSV
jgi:tRNA1Val (adenine37-N6)-methyltransferase